jgi:hypothetical protein
MAHLNPVRFAIAVAAMLTAATGAAAQTAAAPFMHTIPPGKIAEECFKLPAGQTIGYAFEATAPVDFNLHFHRGNDVEYPVQSDQVRQVDDRFTAPSTEEFCLMWTNRALQRVTVKGDLRQ